MSNISSSVTAYKSKYFYSLIFPKFYYFWKRFHRKVIVVSSTIYDVAKAGVSIATVSRVLNNSSAVSENTSEGKRAIEELNYSRMS